MKAVGGRDLRENQIAVSRFPQQYYRVTHLKVTLLQRLVYRVYEVFGVTLIINKYGLGAIDICNNNSEIPDGDMISFLET